MAYNPYFPVTYSYGNYYPQAYQPVAQQQMVQQPQVQATQVPVANQNPATSGIIWVSGEQEAQMYPLAPNNAVALWENSGKKIFLKSADATGKPTMRVYDLVERTQNVSEATSVQEEKVINYVTKEELIKIAGVLESIRGDLETMKGDLYGVAGRKKQTKKMEVDDDDA